MRFLQALLNLCYFVTSFKNIPICAWTFVYYSHSLGGVFVNVKGFSIFLETKGTNIYTAQIQVLDTNRFKSLRQYILFLSVPWKQNSDHPFYRTRNSTLVWVEFDIEMLHGWFVLLETVTNIMFNLSIITFAWSYLPPLQELLVMLVIFSEVN